MTSPATVTMARPAREDFARSQHAVWASLPMSLTEDSDKAQLIAVDGRSHRWLASLAEIIRPGVAGALVVRPVAGPSARDIRAVADKAASAGMAIVVETAWASNPAVTQFRRTATAQLPDISLVDSMAQIADAFFGQWTDMLLDHLSLLRAVTGPLDAVRFTTHSTHGYTVNGGQGPGAVALSAVRSAASQPAVRLAAYGVTAEAHLFVPTGGIAVPAAAWIVDQTGATVQPTLYETASRASWRRLYDVAAEHSSETSPDLLNLADDIELLAAMTKSQQRS